MPWHRQDPFLILTLTLTLKLTLGITKIPSLVVLDKDAEIVSTNGKADVEVPLSFQSGLEVWNKRRRVYVYLFGLSIWIVYHAQLMM